jgi:hypothetical protein
VYTAEQFRDKFGVEEHDRIVRDIEEKKRIAKEYYASASQQ